MTQTPAPEYSSESQIVPAAQVERNESFLPTKMHATGIHTSGEPQPVRVFDYARIEHTRPPARPLARSRTSTQSRWHRVCAHADMAESEPHALSIARARFLSPLSKITQKQSGRANRA